MTPFVARAPRLWLDPDAPAVAAAGCRVRGPEVFARVDLVLRQTARWPIAARVLDGVGFRNSLLAGYASPVWSALLLVALLNSVVVRAQHRALHRDGRQRTFPQVKVAHLRALATPGCLEQETAAAMMALAARLETAGEAGDAEAAWALDWLSLAAYGLPDTRRRGGGAARVRRGLRGGDRACFQGLRAVCPTPLAPGPHRGAGEYRPCRTTSGCGASRAEFPMVLPRCERCSTPLPHDVLRSAHISRAPWFPRRIGWRFAGELVWRSVLDEVRDAPEAQQLPPPAPEHEPPWRSIGTALVASERCQA